MMGGEGVTANRRYMIDDGHVTIEPKYCSTACSRNMAAKVKSASASVSASFAGSVLCV